MEDSACAILTVYNQENIISQIFLGLKNSVTEITKEIIVIIDGCTDKSEQIIESLLYTPLPIINIIHTPDLNETKANNIGLKLAAEKYKYSIIVQDDCMITEKGFDARLLKPFKVIPNLLGVSGRDAEDTKLENGAFYFYNTFGADVNSPRNIFAVRDSVNRGPLMLDNEKLKQLNFLDEDFAPLNQDDTDLCIRAYKQFGYLVGAYVVGFVSPGLWGKTRHDPMSAARFDKAQREHLKMIVERHYDFIVGEKHSRDIEIPE